MVGLDRDPAKRAAFAAGRSPVAEPELDALLAAGHAAGRLHKATAACRFPQRSVDPWASRA